MGPLGASPPANGLRRAAASLAGVLSRWAGAAVAGGRRDAVPLDAQARSFALHLAHEMNNVLAVALSGADVVEAAQTPLEARAAAVVIASAAQDGLDLTARLAALGRQNDLMPLPCDVAGMLAASRPRLERAAGGRGRLRLELANRVLPAMIDRDQFLAAVVEMIIYARTATNHGAVVLRTRLTDWTIARPTPGVGVPGVGVPGLGVPGLGVPGLGVLVEAEAEGRPSAAERSVAAPEGVLREGAGHGLGIAEAFARGSGGRLEQFHSDSLARATLRLPLIQPADLAEPARSRAHALRGGPQARRAVVVEDNDFLRGVLVRGLRERGMEVGEARDAAAARPLLTAGTAVLITDIVLPGDMDGFALARWARVRDPRVALLFVSAFMSVRLPQVLASDELASFVRKPIDLQGLLAVLDGLLAVRDEQAPPPGTIGQDSRRRA